MADFSGHSEKFRVALADDGYQQTDVLLDMSMEGLKIMNTGGTLTKRKVPLDHIMRWSKVSDHLTMFVKTPVDIEEKELAFYGPHSTLTSLLDTLTCLCLQLVEIMEAKQGQETAEAARELRAVAKNGGRRHRELKNADEVEFWSNPDKEGWMHSQGEVIKTWRKRWFVLKDGFLFRFLTNDVTPSSKQRGVVDLSKVGDVSCAKDMTNRPNSVKLGTAKGRVAYLCESETDMVEWISALEGTIARLVRVIAGVADDPSPSGGGGGGGSSAAAAANAKFLQQMEANFRREAPSAPAPAAPRASAHSQSFYSGSNNYPSVAAPVQSSFYSAPQQQSSGDGYQRGRQQQGAGVYRDELGVHYGMGTGTSAGGIAGIGGVRAGNLPATLSIVDAQAGYSAAAASGAPPQQQQYGSQYGAPHGSQQQPWQQQQQQQRPVSLPDTLTVTSIIDEPPTQRPTYGSFAPQPQGGGGYGHPGAPPPQQQQQQQQQQQADPAWEVHYSNGQPYYWNRATGATQWTPP